ncbi:DNA endonuclease SmrA [Pseudoalteromonas luteoviolacea]|uniref:DNA mismatch repair protein MutS n=1 Tax=Pseudoalteromonas luteoviolacea S4054 TaxID=1129367 RepID=A0A0F6AGV8_9GAMM|nr:DNA endonuclease SmrA [Pseudoalteromonas luteoviolacea]AOT09260.1 DNA mismatch repair protein MutS [Pseudoalteromonas luteoviolacea]AOT14172.1 DNA mismatch repair protein MutS [Pseudoalteromonas luteoviolacea]AOT19088.1 DNA mismatch repair protein MutS [Pseudoalteromonas luteoviolacea]KKE85031.1 DNA mismatch repair protein MutS [Pseudoalteromonas luteoviolacea S4054]KZN70149.1 DNA mismatch repair protein MutS [Pseudoalteromonas luteoviolacea S4047-1]
MAMTDEELFLASMGDVVPLAQDNRAQLKQQKNQPTDAQLARREAAQKELDFDPNFLSTEYVDLLDPYDQLGYKKDGVQEGVYKNLRLGKYQIDATLDLHGKSFSEARQAMFEFVTDCQKRNIRVLLIRHGIGLKSKPFPAILKSYCNKWLQEMPSVLAFHSALTCHGGSGSTYTLLKKSEEKKIENREIHAKR